LAIVTQIHGGTFTGSLRRYTNAPIDYDAFRTETVVFTDKCDATGRPIRQVEIDCPSYLWQLGRYQSGLYQVWDEAEFAALAAIAS
jgi:hypothetical protein